MTTEKTHSAEIIEDSISPGGVRLTSMVVVFPRQVLAEFNTHRVYSRNSASSRAIPVAKQLQMIMDNPFIPDTVGKNKSGMQAGEPLSPEEMETLQNQIMTQRDRAIIGTFENLLGGNVVRDLTSKNDFVSVLMDGFQDSNVFDVLLGYYKQFLAEQKTGTAPNLLNAHKETVNRYLEPWMWHEVIVTSTEWSNFFALRDHPKADPKIQKVAAHMEKALQTSAPTPVGVGSWHTPFLNEEERLALEQGDETMVMVSAARSARVSFLTHFGTRDLEKDLFLSGMLSSDGHMSPFEHVATPLENNEFLGNFRGWKQLRKMMPYEDDFSLRS